jgi:hypothetical protein
MSAKATGKGEEGKETAKARQLARKRLVTDDELIEPPDGHYIIKALEYYSKRPAQRAVKNTECIA